MKLKNGVSENHLKIALIGAMLLIFALMLYNLFYFQIFVDESQHIHEGIVFGNNFYFDNEDAPFLYFATEYFFMLLSGSILGARLASIFYGILTLFACYFFLPESFNKSKKIKFVLILGSLPFFIFYSKIAYLDTAVMFFGFIGFLFLIRYMDTEKNKYIIISSILLALGILIKLSIIPFIIGLIFILAIHKLNIDINTLKNFNLIKSEIKNISYSSLINAIKKLFCVDLIIFISIPFDMALFIYQIDSMFPWQALSFSQVTGQYYSGANVATANQISSFLIFKTNLFENIFKFWPEILTSAIVIYGALFLILVYVSKIKVQLLNNKYNTYCAILIIITVLFYILNSRFASRYTLPLLPVALFMIFNNDRGERIFKFAYPLFTIISIITVVFMVTPQSAGFIIGDIAGYYTKPIKPTLDAVEFVNGNTTEYDYVVIEGPNYPLFKAKKLGPYNISGSILQYYMPSPGVKYIIVTVENTPEFLEKKFLLEKVIEYDNKKYYYIFYIDQNQTSSTTPIIFSGTSYFSFPDAILNQQNYYKHKIH